MLAVSALRASSKALTALSIAVWFSAVSVAVALPLASTSGSAVVIAVLSLSNFSLIIAFCFLLKFSFCVLAIGSRSFNLSAFSLTVFSTGSDALPAFGSVTLTLIFSPALSSLVPAMNEPSALASVIPITLLSLSSISTFAPSSVSLLLILPFTTSSLWRGALASLSDSLS